MKVLWLCIDRSTRVASHFDDLRNTFSGLCEVDTITHEVDGSNPQQHSLDLMGRDIGTSLVQDQLKKKD